MIDRFPNPPNRTERDHRWGPFRRLTLTGPHGKFLDRFGIETTRLGVYLHHVAGPDPGDDLHDHPWPFATFVLCGAYQEEHADVRQPGSLLTRVWRAGSFHVVRLCDAHRVHAVRRDGWITSPGRGAWTLVVRGKIRRTWGYYVPMADDGDRFVWVPHDSYDVEGPVDAAVLSFLPGASG